MTDRDKNLEKAARHESWEFPAIQRAQRERNAAEG